MEAGLLALMVSSLFALQGEREQADAERLIQQLDSDSPDERETAEKELLACAEQVEPFLKKAAIEGRPEVRARCQDLLKHVALLRKRREFWNPAKPVTLDLKDAPLKEALEKISKATGYAIRPGAADPEARITVAIKGASFLEAIEAVCLASGAWYRWNGAGIELEKAQPPASRSHAGPVLLSAQLGPSHEDGDLSLNLRLEWEPGVRLRWYEIEIESAVDDQGAAVTVAPSASPAGFVHRLVFFRSHSLPAEGEARFAAEDHVDLAASTKNPARLKSARGKITFFMPEETLRVRFEDPAAGQKKEAGSLVVTLSEFGWGRRNREEWRAGLDLDLTGISASKHSALFSFLLSSKIRFVDAEGKQHDAENGGASSSGFAGDPLQHIGTSVRTSKLPESRAPKALEASIVADVWEKTYPFEFKSVEGPKARK